MMAGAGEGDLLQSGKRKAIKPLCVLDALLFGTDNDPRSSLADSFYLAISPPDKMGWRNAGTLAACLTREFPQESAT